MRLFVCIALSPWLLVLTQQLFLFSLSPFASGSLEDWSWRLSCLRGKCFKLLLRAVFWFTAWWTSSRTSKRVQRATSRFLSGCGQQGQWLLQEMVEGGQRKENSQCNSEWHWGTFSTFFIGLQHASMNLFQAAKEPETDSFFDEAKAATAQPWTPHFPCRPAVRIL